MRIISKKKIGELLSLSPSQTQRQIEKWGLKKLNLMGAKYDLDAVYRKLREPHPDNDKLSNKQKHWLYR